MAQARAQSMTGGMTAENATMVNSDVGNYFMVFDILHSQPMNPALPGSGAGATQDMRNYGISVAAMSQYALTIGMTNSSAMISAMMNDASDGTMNGMMGDTGVQMGGGMMGGNMMQATAGTSDLATAMTNFMGSATNQSGLTATNMLTLINQLAASSGTL
jgi:hypothetical protein